MNKSNNIDKMPASRNHTSFETTVEQKINVPGNSNGANFSNSLLSVNNVYNFDTHSWIKNTILIAGDSMINGTNEKRISTKFNSVKVRFFSGRNQPL